MSSSAPSCPASAPGRARAGGLRRALGVLAAAGVLAATFVLYLRPGLTLDLGQLMAFCGIR